MVPSRFAFAAACLLSLTGCTETGPALQCLGTDGEAQMVITPSLFNYPAVADGEHVPVYVPAQGGVFTELDLEITGVAEDDLGSLSMTMRLDGGDVIGMTIPTMSFMSECQEDGAVTVELQPLQLNVLTPEELDGLKAALIVEMQLQGGLPPLIRDYEVTLDRRTLN